MVNKAISRLINSKYRVPILCGMIVAAPIVFSLFVGLFGLSLGCSMNEAASDPCVRFGIPLGEFLNALGSAGFLSMVTFPLALIVVAVWWLWGKYANKLSRAKLVVLGVFAVVAVTGTIKFAPDKEEPFIHPFMLEEADFVGTWMRPASGTPGTEEGFILKPGGEVETLNMAPLTCSNWSLNSDNGEMTLDCAGTGAGNSSVAPVQYTKVGVSSKRLLLKDPSGAILSYSRRK